MLQGYAPLWLAPFKTHLLIRAADPLEIFGAKYLAVCGNSFRDTPTNLARLTRKIR